MTDEQDLSNPSATKQSTSITWKIFISVWHCFILLFLALLGLTAGLGIGLYTSFSRDLPDIQTILTHRPALITNCYTRDGDVFARFYIEKREIVPLTEINPLLIQASIAVEDLRYYQHKGIDMLGIIRAMRTNLSAGRIVQGGSTITQQLARTLFLSQEKKYSRKIKEAILSLKIENTLSKSQILELYFNEIYFGHGCYGIQAAAKTFFGKGNKELSLSECAMLAGIPKAPNHYSPYDDPIQAKSRREVVLERMFNADFITQKEMQVAEQEQFNLKPLVKRRGKLPYFEEYVRQIIESRFGTTAVHQGGLKVETTIDPFIQQTARQALKWGLHEYTKRHEYNGPLKDNEHFRNDENFPETGTYGEAVITAITTDGLTVSVDDFQGTIKLNPKEWPHVSNPNKVFKIGDRIVIRVDDYSDTKKKHFRATIEQEPRIEGSAVVLDVHSGDILAMVGGYSFDRSQFNRVTLAVRQPGSAFKPIVYSVALDNSFTASTIIYDSPIVEEIPKESSKDDEFIKLLKEKPELWKPENYDETFLGPTTLRRALEKSRNLVTIRLLRKLGVRLVSRYARSYGITTNIEENLSMALGSSGVIPLELTAAYGIFANQGIRSIPRGIKKVFGPDGVLLWENIPIRFEVLDPRVAFLTNYLMQGVIEHGTGQKAARLGRPLAGKTGTTNDFKDAWFVGFSPDIVVGVWVGFDKLSSLGPRESGALAALPIWIKIMENILPRYPYKTFPIPEGIEFALVDKQTGLLASEHSDEVVHEAYLGGTAPTQFSTKQKTSAVTTRDLSTSLLMMEELSRTQPDQEAFEDKANSQGYPSFD